MAGGAADYSAKPIEVDRLLKTIARALRASFPD